MTTIMRMMMIAIIIVMMMTMMVVTFDFGTYDKPLFDVYIESKITFMFFFSSGKLLIG